MNNSEKIKLQDKLIETQNETIESYKLVLKDKRETLDMAIKDLNEQKELLKEAKNTIELLRKELKRIKSDNSSLNAEVETLKPFKPAQVVYLTHNELNVLKEVNDLWHENEGGYGEFSSAFMVISKSQAGTLVQLKSKDLIYDCYDSYEDEEPMWCMTLLGASAMISEGHQYDDDLIYKNEIENVHVVIQ